MKRLSVLVLFVLVACATVGSVSAQTTPEFKLGFKTLADQLPADVVGTPVENEYFNLSNGNSEQHTTKGLMVWRKADNWTAYTNGYMTWINGPNGVQSRLNDDRFAWEKDQLPPKPAPDVPHFGPSNWGDLTTKADEYSGKRVEVAGRVFQPPQPTTGTGMFFQIYLTSKSDGNTVIRSIEIPSGLSKDDFVIVRGVCRGSFQYTNMLGAEVSAPLIDADSIVKVSRADAWAPTIKAIQVNKTINNGGVALRLDKIEIAKEETRVFASIKNNTPGDIHVYEYDARLARGTTQQQAKDNYGTGYPDVPNPLMSGVEFPAVLVFGPIDPSPSTIRFAWDGMSLSNYNSVESFAFEVPY